MELGEGAFAGRLLLDALSEHLPPDPPPISLSDQAASPSLSNGPPPGFRPLTPYQHEMMSRGPTVGHDVPPHMLSGAPEPPPLCTFEELKFVEMKQVLDTELINLRSDTEAMEKHIDELILAHEMAVRELKRLEEQREEIEKKKTKLEAGEGSQKFRNFMYNYMDYFNQLCVKAAQFYDICCQKVSEIPGLEVVAVRFSINRDKWLLLRDNILRHMKANRAGGTTGSCCAKKWKLPCRLLGDEDVKHFVEIQLRKSDGVAKQGELLWPTIKGLFEMHDSAVPIKALQVNLQRWLFFQGRSIDLLDDDVSFHPVDVAVGVAAMVKFTGISQRTRILFQPHSCKVCFASIQMDLSKGYHDQNFYICKNFTCMEPFCKSCVEVCVATKNNICPNCRDYDLSQAMLPPKASVHQYRPQEHAPSPIAYH